MSNLQLKLNTSNTSFSALFVLGPEQDEMTRLDICQKVMVAADYLPIQAQFKDQAKLQAQSLAQKEVAN